MTPPDPASCARPAMKPYRTTAITDAAIMFDTLALENIGVPGVVDIIAFQNG